MPTSPDPTQPTRRGARNATLVPAFAASFFVHVAAFGVLVLVTGGLHPGRTAMPPGAGPDLEVVLAPPRVAGDAAPDSLAVAVAPSSPFDIAPSPSSTAAAPPGITAPVAAGPASADDASGAFKPRVVVTDNVPRARFGEFLEGERLAGFPLEIDAPVRLPGKLEVRYPAAALASREEGTVLVFAIIGEDGHVLESHLRFEKWSPELGKAVHEAVMRTRFLPAMNDGKPIRFYVTLQFDFRIDAPADASVAEGGASPPR